MSNRMMSGVTSLATSSLPSVNLLPPELAADRKFRALRVVLASIIVAALGAIGVLYLGALAGHSSAQDEVTAAAARKVDLQREINTYKDVPTVYAQIAKTETQLATAMGSEVRWSSFLNDLTKRVGRDKWITKVEIVQNVDTPAVSTVQGVDTGGGVIGKVTFSGFALSEREGDHRRLKDWLVSVGEHKSYANAYFSSSKATKLGRKDVVEFQASADVNEQALSRRYLPGKGK